MEGSSKSEHEVENILPGKYENSPGLNDRPLSPVLISSNLNRKHLFGRIRHHRKSRIRLSERFLSESSLKQNVRPIDEQLDLRPQLFSEEDFTLSQTENILNCMERLEEIQKNREKAYKLVVDSNHCDFFFKKPISPAPKKLKGQHTISESTTSSKHESSEIIEDEENVDKFVLSGDEITNFQASNGFQTARGKTICFSESVIKKHKTLFADILTPNQNTSNSRKNKYSFLTRVVSSDTNNVSTKFLGSHNNSPDYSENISLTQEICESGVSNTQMLVATETILNDIENETLQNKETISNVFRGFNHREICESSQIINNFNGMLSTIQSSDDMSKKRKYSDHNDNSYSHQKKKLKLDKGEHRTSCFNNVDNGDQDNPMLVVMKESLGGFSCASEKIITRTVQNLENLGDYSRVANTIIPNKIGNSKINIERAENTLKPSSANGIKNKLKFFDDLIGDNDCDIMGFQSGNDNLRSSRSSEPTSSIESFLGHIDKKTHLKDKLAFFDNMLDNNGFDDMPITNKSKPGFSKASGQTVLPIQNKKLLKNTSLTAQTDCKNKIKMLDSVIGMAETNNNISIFTKSSFKTGFSTASGKSYQLSEKALNKASALFDNLNSEFDNITKVQKLDSSLTNQQMQEKYNTPVIAHSDIKNKIKLLDPVIGEGETNSNKCSVGFSTASGKSYQLAENILNKASALFDDLNSEYDTKAPKLNSSSTNQQIQETYNTPRRKNLFESMRVNRTKRKLGLASCKPIAISSDKLNMAKQMFEEEFGGVSPIRPIQSISNMSTPIPKNHATPRTPLPTGSLKEYHSETLTTSEVLEKGNEIEYKLAEDSLVTFVDPENQCDLDLATELENEHKKLQERLKIVIKRQEALSTLKNEKLEIHRKPYPGKLFVQKSKSNKIPIAAYVDGQTNNGTCDLFFITPQNAENIHFKESSSVLITQDGATVIPNSKDLIGLREIESSIKTMPHVEECLIPKGWIRNHYKWIVWKLASYERMFPSLFKGYLNVEHVIQQLKYRYDREIDKAERPAIRRICEKDDAPQKRLVLCVSNIKKVESGRFELELTDGWYGIRTVIDDPLCNRVRDKKIQVGTKVIMSGAELMHCDGCSPLELTDLTYLKINYNSTRRAIWNAKLGYQRFPGPFPIQIHTVLPTGGPIGVIEICIARVYPIKYLEKIEGRTVWRNKRSEERSAQAWQIEQSRRMEQIEDKIREEFSDATTLADGRKINCAQDISEINNPELLMEIIESSNDPESIQEKLSSSQRTAVLEYRQNSFAKKMQEISAKAKEGAGNLKMAERDVVSVLQMLVVDANGSPTTAFGFTVWRPTESHFDVLREGTCIKAYNVLPRMNGNLSAGSKTLFRAGKQKDQMSDIFKRKLIDISDISDMKFCTNFSEFDTVGLVVQMKIEKNHQDVWLTNTSGRLLLIEINEGPSTCLLLDKLKRGQPTTVCNLTYKGTNQDFIRASGNHFSIFSCYSQFRHLQEGLDKFQKVLPKDCDKLLQECDEKIGGYSKSPNTTKNVSHTIEKDYDEDVLVPSRITRTDIALSLLDIEKLS